MIDEGEVSDEPPWSVFRGVWGAAFVVFGKAEFQTEGQSDGGQSDGGLPGVVDAAEEIDVMHRIWRCGGALGEDGVFHRSSG
ncbi:hypothetical protein HNR46_002350 [Haloferula luteola]|uniref:Uncharacterized protein n=1 Tax=Haloferula luteola TaxID=595692 RepID=A0A840VE52_9BACT|nr:hypothetical protein [Haloferula luteola]MBB5352109.1 hypothetical protein [Haloferula luteola]